MSTKYVKSVTLLITILMGSECIGAAFFPCDAASDKQTTFHATAAKASIFALILGEKTEEGSEKHEEERDKIFVIELIDFSKIAALLSQIHSPVIHFAPLTNKYDLHPSLFTLFCVFII